jgi:hypothetical protein
MVAVPHNVCGKSCLENSALGQLQEQETIKKNQMFVGLDTVKVKT